MTEGRSASRPAFDGGGPAGDSPRVSSSSVFRRVVLLIAAVVMPWLASAGDSESVPSHLREAPLPMVRLVRHGDARAWSERAEQHGIRDFLATYEAIARSAPTESEAEFEDYWKRNGPLIERLHAFVRGRTGCDFVALDAAAVRQGGVGAYRARRALWDRVLAWDAPGDVDTQRRIDALSALVPAVDSLGTPEQRGRIRAMLVYLYARHQDQAGMWSNAREAFAYAQACQQPRMQCELIGIVGLLEGNRDRRAELLARWREGWALSLRFDLPDQQARFSGFLASYYHRDGRHAAAQRWHEQTLRVLDRHDLGVVELEYLDRIARFHVGLGAWDAARRVRERIESTSERLRRANDPGLRDRPDSRIEGELAFHDGDVAAGERHYAEVQRRDRLGSASTRDPEYLVSWVRGLVSAGRFERALAVATPGLQRARAFPVRTVELELLRARAAVALDRDEEAWRALAAFDSVVVRAGASLADQIARNILASRLELRRGQPDRALDLARVAIDSIRVGARFADASAQTDIWLEQCADARFALHDALGGDALARYGAEVLWSGIHGGASDDPSAPEPSRRHRSPTAATALRALARHSLGALPRGSVHVRYVRHGNEVWRFVASPHVLVLDTLTTTATVLRERIRTVVDALAREPRTPRATPDAPLERELRALSNMLLPDTVLALARAGRASASPPCLLVSGDAAITSFPYEALRVKAGAGELPLLEIADVAYVRRLTAGVARDPADASGDVLVVANPQLPHELARQLDLFGDLEGAKREAAAVVRWLGDAEILTGASATRSALMARWERARVLVIAAHVLRSGDSPFLVTLPLASGPDADPASAALDLNDARSADLSRCQLAILSGCATGAPYLGGEHPAPSFGDAVLDAGARATVWTFWDVRDDRAAVFTDAFLAAWTRSGGSAVRALSDCRRMLRRTWPHPHEWAAFGVEVRDLGALGERPAPERRPARLAGIVADAPARRP